MTSKVFKYFRVLAVFLVVFIVFFSFPSFCTGHDHSHDDHHDHDHHHHDESPVYKYSKDANTQYSQSQPPNSSPPPRPRKQMSISRLWMEALSSTLIISIAPFLILFFVPLNHRRGHESLLKVLLSFASGGLLGDAFLHLIPHALHPHSHDDSHSHQHSHDHDHSHSHSHSHGHDHDHSHDSIGAWVLAGILAFLILDKCMRLLKGEHSHSHSHVELPEDNSDNEKEANEEDNKDDKDKDEVDNTDAMSESDDHIKTTAFLNLIVDFVHNLTDGLAIGASYLAGETVGLVTTITVLFHEVPHEIGDFAILVQSGCSKKKAMLFQLVTALGAFLGTFISLVSGGVDAGTTSWALPFTAGGFIYISTVSIIPELLTDSSFGQSIKEILALLTGVSLMVLVALFE